MYIDNVLKKKSTHVADIVVDNSTEEELGAVGDGFPGTERVDVLFSVFDLTGWDKDRWAKAKKASADKITVSFRSTDLADVVSDSAVVGDVQSILHRVVAALGELKGLFVT